VCNATAVAQWLKCWTVTDKTWISFLLASIAVIAGGSNGIQPKLFTCSREVSFYTWTCLSPL